MPCSIVCLCGISSHFWLLSPCIRQVTHALLTRPPLSHIKRTRRIVLHASFDLHVLSTPPAFILSQDQTLVKNLWSKWRLAMSSIEDWWPNIISQRLIVILLLPFFKTIFTVFWKSSIKKMFAENYFEIFRDGLWFSFQSSFLLLLFFLIDSLYSLSYLKVLVKNFFKFFLKNF